MSLLIYCYCNITTLL